MGNYSYTYLSSIIPTSKDVITDKRIIDIVPNGEYKYSISLLSSILCGTKFLTFAPSLVHPDNSYKCMISDTREGVQLAKRVYTYLASINKYVTATEVDNVFKQLEMNQNKYKFVILDTTDLAVMNSDDPRQIQSYVNQDLKKCLSLCNQLKNAKSNSNSRFSNLFKTDILTIIDKYFDKDEISLYMF